MATLYKNIDSNKHKTWLLMSGFALFIPLVGWVFASAMHNPVILYVAVIIAIIQPLVAYYYSDKMVLMMSGARELDHENARELYHSVENLCITAGLPMPKIYLIEDSAPNAFATGRDANHAAIAVTSGILGKLNKRELEGVLAHELSHIGNRDILLSTIVTVLVGIVVLLADWFMRWSIFGGRKSNDREGGDSQMALIITVLAIILAILAPIFAQMIQLAVSRKREFLADASGAMLTRDPEGLASALLKISQDDEALEVANRATAHLYIASPFKSDRAGAGLAKLFMTHPPIADRVKALREFDIK